MYRDYLKRVLDVTISLTLLVLLAPAVAALAVLVRWRLGSPVIFRQTRPGRNGSPFVMYKLRTMTNECDRNGEPLPDSKRLTKFGAFLRSTSLDELPELLNVLRGEMSLVGPRPLLTKYQPYYSEQERKRFDVRPGITGWAQVNGRNAVRWNERLQFDAWYAENVSFALDFRILARTIKQAIRHQDVVIDPRSTMLDLDVERGADGSPNHLQAG